MSHFTVLVVADDDKHLEKVLLPYHEYECTGIKQYTEFVIEHPADRVQAHALAIIQRLQEGDDLRVKYQAFYDAGEYGEIFDSWDGTVPDKDGNYGHTTNPNAKWDWWLIGGRWTGLLKLKDGATGQSGTPGIMTDPNRDTTRADGATAGDVDWDGMIKDRIARRLKVYDAFHDALQDSKLEEVAEGLIEKARERFSSGAFEDYPFITDIETLARFWAAERICVTREDDPVWIDPEDWPKLVKSREEFAAGIRVDALTFAFVDQEGKWNERGNMGWWAIVTDKNPDYDEAFWKFVRSLPDDQRVYVVDCHI